jgi:hypothetical protein
VKAIESAAIEAGMNSELSNSVTKFSHPILSTSSEKTLKKLTLVAIAVVFCMLAANAFGQGFDAAFGVSSIISAKTLTTNGLTFPSERGGLYPGFSVDLLIHHRLGIEGELFWKGSQGLYGTNQPYRPIFYDFNAIWAPHITKNLTGEVMAGIGGEDLRFYGLLNFSQFAGYTNYVSSNHFMGDVGGGIRAYVWHDAFIRPELRLYLINNNVEFSSGRIVRYGVSIGYSFAGR